MIHQARFGHLATVLESLHVSTRVYINGKLLDKAGTP